ncbi:transporter [Cellulomonas sp. Root485]|uniref:alpha/beta hydrolase n=1 Tax=Cellulomonas sp. Root485 TaxID=1736546 RepID=UPI000700DE7E|nr:alpha/beta hydrolase [Cellulomonas sp. Root485]KQY23604.1 transporter [Cellulomonas sp. Root485]
MPLSARLVAPTSVGRHPRHRAAVAVVAAALAVVVLLAGCVSPKNQASGQIVESPTAEATGELARYYGQQLEWTACEQGECATAQVPLDYADPAGPSIGIALARARATGGEPVASLLLNRGGPGASGVDFVSQVAGMVSADITRQFDLVGFDPRGVQRSSPVTCVDAAGLDEIIAYDADYSTDAGIQDVIDMYGELGAACEQNTGAALGHVDTVSAARDLDILRAALGDATLTYLGFSYGTLLGATYAALFPEKVGRLVLDGAKPPTLTYLEVSEGQAVGFENALRAYITDCQAGPRCPLDGSLEDGLAQISELFERANANPLPTGTDRALTRSLAFSGIALPLYAQSYWPLLTQALTAALDNNDGSMLLQLADQYYDRQPDGTFSTNSTVAFNAINCLDNPGSADFATMRAEAAQIEEAAPTVGYFFGFGGTVCAQWPVPAVGTLDSYTAEGAAPILVVGTTGDPATPYEWAVKLADLLSSATLLTYEGEGHTAYGSSNDCIADTVDAYLLTGAVPADGTRC